MVGWQRRVRLGMVFAALATLALLAGCNLPGQQTSDLANDQTLKIVLPLDGGGENPLANLDPAQGLYPPYLQASSLLFDGLLTLDRNGHVEPWGAQSWTVSPDGLAYTFTLRPHQRFSDGAPVKASDYAWSIDRIANPCLSLFNYDSSVFTDYSFLALVKDAPAFHNETCARGQPTGAITSLIGDALLPNDSAGTLTFILIHPAGYFLAALATSWSDVVERSVMTGANLGGDGAWTKQLDAGKTGQGGSGMFYLADAETGAAATTSGKLTLKPNPHWWGLSVGKTPHFSEVDILIGGLNTFLDDTSIGYGDVLGSSALPGVLPEIKRAPYFRETPSFSMAVLHFNWKVAPFDDLNARKAFCLAANREYLNQQAYRGGFIPSWHLIPQGMPGFNAAVAGVDDTLPGGDVALAQRYWQKYLAAHGGRAPALTFYTPYPHSDYGQLMSPLIPQLRDLWQQTLGVAISLAASPSSANVTPIEASSDYPDPREFMGRAVAPDGQPVSVPGVDTLLRQADTLSTMDQRLPLYQQVEQLLVDNVAVCPLFQTVNSYAMRTRLRAFTEDARGLIPNDAWVRGYIAHGQ